MKDIGESSRRMEKHKRERKEDMYLDYCCVCKDRGQLMICHRKHCLKAYHLDCVREYGSFIKTGKHGSCVAHSCFICHKIPEYNCLCCPKALCRSCIVLAEFVRIKGKYGLCSVCLELALAVEENMDVDSYRHYVGHFDEYWKIINGRERLTLENLRSAEARMKKGKCFEYSSDSDEHDGHIKTNMLCDGKAPVAKRKKMTDRNEFVRWGSRALINFLKSIDVDVSQALPQKFVTARVKDYVKEKKLFHPDKKGTIICDEKLQTVLGQKTVKEGEIFDYLNSYFDENQQSSGEDDIRSDSKDKQGKSDVYGTCPKEKKYTECSIPLLQYASIDPKNMRLVYLKRSLIENLVEEPRRLFDRKVIGSFVKFRSDPKDRLLKNTHKLVQVTGTKRISGGVNGFRTLLQVSGMKNDICISSLSDGDITEDECEELKLCIQGGLLKQPTVVELERKARSLHEDITKHWITRQMDLLQIQIDRANEKGWRKEFYEYSTRRQLLQTSTEQAKLLNKIPSVVAAKGELELICKDANALKQGDQRPAGLICMGSSETPCHKCDGNRILSGDQADMGGNSSSGPK